MTNAILTGNVTFAACRYHGRRLVHDGALRVVCLAIALLAGATEWAHAEENPGTLAASERSVKAAFLYKFTAYVEWPASAFPQPETPLLIGVAGADEVASELQQLTASRTVNNRPIAVRRVRDVDALDGLHVLFVGGSDPSRIASFARAAQHRSILFVTDSPGALDNGSVINFLIVDGRVRFEISLEAAERSGLKLSSRLLAVAQAVRPSS